MTEPIITVDGDTVTVVAPIGFMRLAFDQARIASHSSATAYGVSTGWRNTWSGYAAALRAAADRLPPPSDPRDPYGSGVEESDAVTAPPVIAPLALDETHSAPATEADVEIDDLLGDAAPADDIEDLLA